ncbi:MAG: hypothetical protein Q8M40_00210 [Legionella sp.]|nr:hypothetical protein [Legionella sp.]
MLLVKKMEEDVKCLKEQYNKLSVIQRFFFPKKLRATLDELHVSCIDNNQLHNVYTAFAQSYFSRWWFMQSWFHSCLFQFARASRFYPGVIAKKSYHFLLGPTEIIMNAYDANLFAHPNSQLIFNAIALNDGDPEWIVAVLKVLKNTDLITQTNIDSILNLQQEPSLVTALTDFYNKGLLQGEQAQNNLSALLSDSSYHLVELSQQGKISQETLINYRVLNQPQTDLYEKNTQQSDPMKASASNEIQDVSLNSENMSANTLDGSVNFNYSRI